jgi:hypothetical protein
MNLFTKIKKSIFKEPKKKSFGKEFLDLINSTVNQEKNNPKNKPENLNLEEWKSALTQIYTAFLLIDKGDNLRSPARKKIRQQKIKHGLELFQKYYNNIK